MRYKNTTTGASIETPDIISGDSWVKEDEAISMNHGTVDLSEMTISQLKNFAQSKGIEIGGATKKEEIVKAIAESDGLKQGR